MIGLIKKDILMMKGSLKRSILMILIFLIIALREASTMIFIPAFLSTMAFMSTFSYDEYNNWNAYAISLPKGRKNLVKAKYITNLGMLITVVAIFCALTSIIGLINNNGNLEETVYLSLGCIFALAIFQALLYPFIFKFGIEKGRIAILIGVFGLTGVAGLLKDKVNIEVPKELMMFLENNWLLLALIAVIIILLISYLISRKIVDKKEF